MDDATKILGWILDHAAVWSILLAAWGVRLLLKVDQCLFGAKGETGLVSKVEEMIKRLGDGDKQLQRHEQTLFGPNGDNGHHGRLEELGKRTHSLADKVQNHEGRLDEHQVQLETLSVARLSGRA